MNEAQQKGQGKLKKRPRNGGSPVRDTKPPVRDTCRGEQGGDRRANLIWRQNVRDGSSPVRYEEAPVRHEISPLRYRSRLRTDRISANLWEILSFHYPRPVGKLHRPIFWFPRPAYKSPPSGIPSQILKTAENLIRLKRDFYGISLGFIC